MEGLAAYRDRRWDAALGAFNASLEAMPGDGPTSKVSKQIRLQATGTGRGTSKNTSAGAGRPEKMRVGTILQELGVERRRRCDGDKLSYRYYRAEA